jgi:hypothetical protein
VDQLVGPLLYRHLVSGDPIAPDIPARLVDAFFSAHPPPPREAREQEHP